jgi:NCAIR mutase (PurE)-related protein
LDEGRLRRLLGTVARGELSTEDAVTRLARLPFEDLGFAHADAVREVAPEAEWHPRSGRQAADVLVVVAGMEGALPSLVAGMVAAPVIAVPTSGGPP